MVGLGILEERGRRENRRLADANEAIRAAEARDLADLKLTRGSLGWILEQLDGPELGYLPESGPVRLQLAGGVLKLYQDLRQAHPHDPDVKFELARARRIAANIGRSMGESNLSQQRYLGAIALMESLARTNPGSEGHPIERARAHHDHGEYLRMAGQPRPAEDEQLKVLEVLKPHDGAATDDDPFPRLEASALINLAAARLETGRPGEALRKPGGPSRSSPRWRGGRSLGSTTGSCSSTP